MSIQTVGEVDAQIVNAHWRWLHGVWEDNAEEMRLARAAIDALLERRYEIVQAAEGDGCAPVTRSDVVPSAEPRASRSYGPERHTSGL